MYQVKDAQSSALGPRPFPKTLVVGLGRTGLSCARFLRGRGVAVTVVDSRQEPPGLEGARREMPDLRLFVGGFDATSSPRPSG